LLANRTIRTCSSTISPDLCDTPFGPGLRQEIRRKYGTVVVMAGRGEMIANENSFCELDPTVKDRLGIPVLRFHWKWGDTRSARRLTWAKPSRNSSGAQAEKSIWRRDRRGEGDQHRRRIIHEVGTTRMGSSAKASVVNQHGQSWSVRNLFVVDGGVFVSSPHKIRPSRSSRWRGGAAIYLVDHQEGCAMTRSHTIRVDRRTTLGWLGAVTALSASVFLFPSRPGARRLEAQPAHPRPWDMQRSQPLRSACALARTMIPRSSTRPRRWPI